MEKLTLHEWAIINEPSKNSDFYDPFWTIMDLIKFWIARIWFGKLSDEKITVISEYSTGEGKYPLIKFDLKEEYETEILLSYKFHHFIISIDSNKPINCDFMGVLDEVPTFKKITDSIPDKLVYGKYEGNSKKFTGYVKGHYRLFTFMWILHHHLTSN
ncbi:hypothetical protein GLV94_08055 [Virgibacillus halodenitrificans]|uniref:hypothetical protein n=1 Tax=Virgibacillus halodenitrificans TaxID=1482 RepID=UPI00136947E3|nr:hypothetical protein [Virgibacillus halodenitrificans]MYL45598.1 hypothetical protein [Virgibacillus halodenitrificans]